VLAGHPKEAILQTIVKQWECVSTHQENPFRGDTKYFPHHPSAAANSPAALI